MVEASFFLERMPQAWRLRVVLKAVILLDIVLESIVIFLMIESVFDFNCFGISRINSRVIDLLAHMYSGISVGLWC